jgi:cytochrome c2
VLKAYREGKIPFPDGTGSAKNVQFMVKDSKNYAATGGWAFAYFKDGKPAGEAVHEACFACHEAAKERD